MLNASPAHALMLARKENACCLATLAYNAGLLAAGVSEGSRDGVLFGNADVVLEVRGEEAGR